MLHHVQHQTLSNVVLSVAAQQQVPSRTGKDSVDSDIINEELRAIQLNATPTTYASMRLVFIRFNPVLILTIPVITFFLDNSF